MPILEMFKIRAEKEESAVTGSMKTLPTSCEESK